MWASQTHTKGQKNQEKNQACRVADLSEEEKNTIKISPSAFGNTLHINYFSLNYTFEYTLTILNCTLNTLIN